MRTDGQTGMKLIVAFRNFANLPKHLRNFCYCRHYFNITERGFARDWRKAQRQRLYIHFGCQQACSEVVGQLPFLAADPLSSYRILGRAV
jgi:hypothetical protein